ncbi:hypothetical protein, partial [Plasmodium yoelii yoelii]
MFIKKCTKYIIRANCFSIYSNKIVKMYNIMAIITYAYFYIHFLRIIMNKIYGTSLWIFHKNSC